MSETREKPAPDQGMDQSEYQENNRADNASRWGKGRSGNPAGRPPGPKDVPKVLKDMRRVFNYPETADKTEAHKNCRQALKDDRNRFITQLLAAEKEYRKGAEKAEAAEAEQVADVDEGIERIMKMSQQFLDEMAAIEAQENAEFASRPNAAEIGATLQKRLTKVMEREEKLMERVKELEGEREELRGKLGSHEQPSSTPWEAITQR
jgi:hypothetical protein